MVEKLYPLQLVKFNDKGDVAHNYSEALKGRGLSFTGRADATAYGATIGTAGAVVIFLLLTMAGVVTSFVPGIILAILAGVGSGFLMNRWYGKAIQKILNDPEKLYRYKLSRAVSAYNDQAEAYNEYLLVGEENMTLGARQLMLEHRDMLNEKRDKLQKKNRY